MPEGPTELSTRRPPWFDMPDKHYDVIVIGRSIGPLAAAALLARRDFTVLVVGHGRRPADYAFEGRTLRRRAFTMLSATSPVWRRITAELAQTQTWQQRTRPLSPMLQVIDPRGRLDVPPDNEQFQQEVERELPEVRRLVSELYANFARVAAAADVAFEREAVWPPGTFLERRQTGRIASLLPYARAEPHADLLAEFPRQHRYRRIVTESVRFATDLAGRPPAFAVARLHASWTRGVYALEGGEKELSDMLLDRVEANGGERIDERAAGIEVRRGHVSGVILDGATSAIGAGWVITDLTGEEIAVLSGGQGVSKKAQREWPRVVPSTMRYVVSLVVGAEGVPAPLGREVLVFPGESTFPHAIHLQRCPGAREGEVLLVAEILRGERDPLPLREARGWVIRQLCRTMPFLENHLLVVDSVHDGLPLWAYPGGGGRPREVARTSLGAAAARVEPMERQLEVDPPGYLGLAGEPIRGPIGRTLLTGPSVLPGLGQEGCLLAAASAARIVTQSDRRKARMRREMWTKLEIS